MDNMALMDSVLINIALATILLPFAGAILTGCLPQQWAKWSCTLFSLLATLGTVLLAYAYLSGGKIDVTFDLIHYGDMALFGLTIDRISTLIAFAVVFLGLLVSIYSTGYLTLGNRDHPHEGTNRYYALLLAFIGAMAGLAITGVPPLNGFFSKFPIFAAGFSLSGEHWLLIPLLVRALIESVASFGWFLYWFGQTVPGKPSEAVASAKPLPLAMQVVLVIMSVCSSFIAVAWLG